MTTFNPTNWQIEEAQMDGKSARKQAEAQGQTAVGTYDAYRSAYDATMRRFEIDRLIVERNTITDQMYPDEFYPDTSAIDALLSAVPAGQRNDVDLLLGRSGAQLPNLAATKWSTDAERAEWKAQADIDMARLGTAMVEKYDEYQASDTTQLIETTRRIWRETEAIEY